MADLTQIVTELNERATTEDGLKFSIPFPEFEGAPTGELKFTAKDQKLDDDDARDRARELYNKLRTVEFDEHGFASYLL